MRLFTAIDLSDEVRANIEELQARLKPTAPIQWSPSSNLHITTKFIGAWPEARLEELQASLRAIPPVGPIEIRMRGVGWFAKGGTPHSFYVGAEAPPALYVLAKATDQAANALGVELESKPYTPHLTLARIRGQQPLDALRQAVKELEPLELGSFSASRYHLYVSEPAQRGTIYTKLADFSLIP